MKKSKYSAERVTFALRQAESGTPVAEVCRKMAISEQTFYHWKKIFVLKTLITRVSTTSKN
jgi:putative transposase